MTAAPSATHGPMHSSYAIHSEAGGDKSPGIHAGKPFDMHRFRSVFPDRWSRFLRNHFRNAVHIAFFFNVDEKTARNWLDGVSTPSGHVVLATVAMFPGAVQALWHEAA